jgi:O-antigen/teichoic acid export membrane protein
LTEKDAKVARGVAALYVANITTLVLNTAFLVLLTNYYNASVAPSEAEYYVGVVAFLNVVLVAAATFSVLALPLVGSGVVATPPAVARFLHPSGEAGAGGARRVYLLSLVVCGVISACIVLVGAYSPVASLVAGPQQAAAVFFACVDALVYAFAQLGAYTMLGSDMATSAGKIIIVSSSLRYVFASVLLLAGLGPSGVFIGFALGDSLLALVSNARSFRAMGLPAGPGESMKPVVKYMVSVFLTALMGLAVSQTDKLLTFFRLGLGNLAVYNIATVGAAVASFAPSAATNVLVPALSRFGSDEASKLEMLKVYTRHISLSAVPIGFEIAAVSPFLLRMFGDPYAQGAPVMAIIALAISFTAISSVYASSLLVDDRAHHFALSNLLGLAGLVVVAVLTVPTLGFVGIALGRAAMLAIMLAAVAYFVWRSGRLVLDTQAYLKSLGASALMALFVFAVLLGIQDFGFGRFTVVASSIVMMPVGFALYVLAMKLLRAFSVEDMDFIDSLLPKSLRRLSGLARKLL